MPKIKSNSGAKKRLSINKNGKVKRSQAGKRHLLECKDSGRKRSLRGSVLVEGGFAKKVKKLLPYM